MDWMEELRYTLAAERISDGTNSQEYRDRAVFLALNEWLKRDPL
jgi:hypothetical protein